MKYAVVDKTGKEVENIELSHNLFGIRPNDSVLAQYIRVYLFNQRQGTSSTKTRAEVSGGGKKPWRQKGTGRARVGSSRNPIWRHGGVSHGPKPRSWNKSISKQMRRLAIASALSFKVAKKNLIILDSLSMQKPNTSELVKVLGATKAMNKRTLVVLGSIDANIMKSLSNIPGTSVTQVSNINAYEIALAKKVLFLKDSVHMLEEKYNSNSPEVTEDTNIETSIEKVKASKATSKKTTSKVAKSA